MDWMIADDYDVARFVVQRGVALAYVLAFVNVVNQFRPLLGEHGLLPVPTFLDGRDFRSAPSIFHWRYSDRMVAVVAWSGASLAALALVGLFDRVPVGVALAGWLVLWALYLSVVNVGQRFYGFGWESLLLETGFLVAFSGNEDVGVPIVTLIALRWLLFRVEFGAGMIKMRGDPCWRDLTCLEYHHETQPMPSPTSRWFHLMPRWFHRSETAANHVAQLVAPWLLFLPQPLAGVGGAVVIVTQAYLMLSGNYAWLNFLTLVLGFTAIPDGWFAAAGVTTEEAAGMPTWYGIAVLAAGGLVVALSWQPLANLFGSSQKMNASFNRYHLVNAYGAFGSVTRHRREVVIEGSLDGSTWKAYEFRAKPGDPSRRPAQFAPYHLRLDWLMWFVAISPSYGSPWFPRLLDRLLAADPAVLGLLSVDPFGGEPPSMIRARMVDYRFATRAERRRTGNVWVVGSSATLVHPVSRAV